MHQLQAMHAVFDSAYFSQHLIVQMDQRASVHTIQQHLVRVHGKLRVQTHQPSVQSRSVNGAVVAGTL